MKALRTLLHGLVMGGLVFYGCSKNNPAGSNIDNVDNTEPTNSGQITRSQMHPSGDVTETSNGYIIKGSLDMDTEESGTVSFANADLNVEFNPDGTLKNISGRAQIPQPANFVEFADPVQADVGYFSGKYLNENRDFDIVLKEDISYFVYHIALAAEMKIGGNDDPNSTKPLSLKLPVGGHILYVADYNDPMFFFSGAQDLLGSLGFGSSLEGKIPYVPLQPVDGFRPFDGNSIRSGSFPIFKVIEASGSIIRNIDFSAQLTDSDPLGVKFSAGYQAGINGAFDLSLPIATFVSFGIPLGEASAAVSAELSSGGFVGQAFINGLAARDNTWWPNFIPVKPSGQIRTTGFVQQDGSFRLGLQGEFNLQLPSANEKYVGSATVTNDDFTMEGSVTNDDLTWKARATFLKDATEYAATPPQKLLDDISSYVEAEIDSGFDALQKALQDLEDRTADYEFELSLRGLRSSLPKIISEARDLLSSGMKSAETKARKKIKDELAKRSLKLCSDDLKSVIKTVTEPYRTVLDRLESAVAEPNDNDRTRSEIEAALRDAASKKRFKKTVTVTVKVANKTLGCTFSSTQTGSATVDVRILPDDKVSLILEAADNVKYLAETSDRKFKARKIYDELPSKEELEKLRADIQSGVKKIPGLSEVGFIYSHDDKTYSFYVVHGGKRHDVPEFDMFDGGGVGGAIINILK